VAVTRLGLEAPECLIVTQNVDDLHLRATHNGASVPLDRLVQIHGDLFVERCERCGYSHRVGDAHPEGLPTCPGCAATLRPGVVWFGEQLDPRQVARVERFLSGGPCDAVLVIGTTAQFGYILDWIQRARASHTRVFEVNPEETSASPLVTDAVREPAALAVPRIVAALLLR
jgi:NAD-dependent deacetylase